MEFKTLKSFPRVKFQYSFTLSANEKHFSKEQESLKLLDDFIISYVETEGEKLELPTQAALIIMDVFKGHMTTLVVQKIALNNNQLVKAPPNLTYIYQPLDVTANGAAKQFMKRKFVDWYSRQIVTKMNKGADAEEIDLQMKLSLLESLHASWLIELYNCFTSNAGREVCMKGWEKSGIHKSEIYGLPSLDPFKDIDRWLRMKI